MPLPKGGVSLLTSPTALFIPLLLTDPHCHLDKVQTRWQLLREKLALRVTVTWPSTSLQVHSDWAASLRFRGAAQREVVGDLWSQEGCGSCGKGFRSHQLCVALWVAVVFQIWAQSSA